MYFSTNFSGRLIQLTDALDRFDAVSNQVVAIDSLLSAQGFRTLISSQWAHPEREHLVTKRDDLMISEQDVLIVHFYGFSEGLEEWLGDQYCTKVMVYHNITPESFFDLNETMRDFCLKGRQQLQNVVPLFHFFWGDSQFNVDELIGLGVDPATTAVIPIVVDPAVPPAVRGTTGQWLFVGRVAPNKGHLELIEMFARVRKRNPDIATSLKLIGGFDSNDGYSELIRSAISRFGCEESIHLLGKLSDFERDEIFRNSDFYISLSEHEGFGVPLVEAASHAVPVLALDRAATAETLGGFGVFKDILKLEKFLISLGENLAARDLLLRKQQENAGRFGSRVVSQRLIESLKVIIPSKGSFKTVSVVICTYNRKDYLERCLDYLSFQSNDRFEVVVVDGPSDDGTDAVLERRSEQIKVVKNPERNLSKSRNLGIDAAAGDIVAFIDDDAIPFDDWVDRILKEYNERPLTTAGLGGPAYYAGSFWFQAEDNGISADGQVKVNIASSEIGRAGWYRYNTGTNATFARKALKDIDGFDEQFDYFLDEFELCLRLQKSGRLIGYAPELFVRHEFAKSHNRSGRFTYNWFTICKNTAYFIAANSGMKGKKLRDFIDKRIEEERVAPLNKAVNDGELIEADRDRHVEAIRKGVEQGLKDARHWPRTREIPDRPDDFRAYATRRDNLAVGRDLPPLHICIVSKEFPPFTGAGGVGTLYYHLASELLLMGHHVSVVVPGDEGRIHRQGRLSIHFTVQKHYSMPIEDNGFAGNVDWSLSALTKLSTIHRERPIDVVDSSLWDSETLAFSLLDERPPLVVRLVTPFATSAAINSWNPSALQAEYFVEAERTLLRRADAIIPISRMIASTVEKNHHVASDGRWSVGHAGVAPWPTFDVNAGYDDFPELEALGAGGMDRAKIVLFIGRLELRKGIDLVRDAAPSILANPDAVLVIAGRDPENWSARFQEAVPRELHSRMIFLGEVSDAMREKLLAHAYCVLFPSRYESFGLVPLEAFVHACPVIATKVGAIPEVIADDRSGILIQPDEPGALAQAVERLLADKELHERLSKGAQARVKELSARSSALHTVEVYQRLVGTH